MYAKTGYNCLSQWWIVIVDNCIIFNVSNHIKKRLSVDHYRHLKQLKTVTLTFSQLIVIEL